MLLNDKMCGGMVVLGVAYDKKRQVFWAIFDSLTAVGKFETSLVRSDANVLVPSARDGYDGESQFEGVFLDSNTDSMYLLIEAIEAMDMDKAGDSDDVAVYRAVVQSVDLSSLEAGGYSSYSLSEECVLDFEFESDSKGFESMRLITVNGIDYFLGLCVCVCVSTLRMCC